MADPPSAVAVVAEAVALACLLLDHAEEQWATLHSTRLPPPPPAAVGPSQPPFCPRPPSAPRCRFLCAAHDTRLRAPPCRPLLLLPQQRPAGAVRAVHPGLAQRLGPGAQALSGAGAAGCAALAGPGWAGLGGCLGACRGGAAAHRPHAMQQLGRHRVPGSQARPWQPGHHPGALLGPYCFASSTKHMSTSRLMCAYCADPHARASTHAPASPPPPPRGCRPFLGHAVCILCTSCTRTRTHRQTCTVCMPPSPAAAGCVL